jgi:hypothetical protein
MVNNIRYGYIRQAFGNDDKVAVVAIQIASSGVSHASASFANHLVS